MAKTKISEWSATPANNTDIDNINIAEGCAPSGINDAIREMMAQIKDLYAGTSGDIIAVAAGGTGVGTSTGSGSNVLSTSPTLVTPALGTPSALVGTNITGTATSFNINGTVGATTPTTGAFTTVAASGNVTLSGGTANGVAYLNGSKVVTSGSALTFDGTNLGVGTGSVTTTGNFFTSTTSGYFFAGAGTYTGGIYGSNSGNYANIKAPTDIVSYIGSSEQMRLTSTGLGIGTSSPANKLSVYAGGIVANFGAYGTGAYDDIELQAYSGYCAVGTRGSTPLVFNIARSEKMRLDTSGNLGLGVTPSAWGSSKAFQVSTKTSISEISGDAHFSNNAYFDGSGWKYIGSGTAQNYYQSGGLHAWRTAASGTAGNAITFTQAMTLDASGNLGIGTTSPSASDFNASSTVVQVKKNDSNGGLFKASSSNVDFVFSAGGGLAYIATTTNTPITFLTNSSERARIDSSGNLLVGTTSNANSGKFVSSFSSGCGGSFEFTGGTGATNMVLFSNGNGVVGSILTSGSATSYNTSSDYRLKNTIAPMTGALAKVALLKPCTYKWNADGSDGEGFIAHELAEVVPQCVTGEKDAVDEDGNPKYQGVDTSFLVATLTAALQEQQAIIESLKARLDAANL